MDSARLFDDLRRFNRKERFHLIKWALGNPTFELDEKFRQCLGERLSLTVPRCAFAAMDYHLDRIYAALHRASRSPGDATYANPVIAGSRVLQGHQEDIDLLCVFKDQATHRVVMIEAKGVTGWRPNDLHSKARRMKAIFGDDGKKFGDVTPHFVLTWPGEPRKFDDSGWPIWMRGDSLKWIRMPISQDMIVVKRLDRGGERWTVKDQRLPK